MAAEMSEAYLEWLEREEEVVGLIETMRASTDIEAARDLLRRELQMEPTDAQLDAFMGAGGMRYSIMPEANVGFERVEQVWGKQSIYRSLETGRFVSRTYVEEAIARLEL